MDNPMETASFSQSQKNSLANFTGALGKTADCIDMISMALADAAANHTFTDNFAALQNDPEEAVFLLSKFHTSFEYMKRIQGSLASTPYKEALEKIKDIQNSVLDDVNECMSILVHIHAMAHADIIRPSEEPHRETVQILQSLQDAEQAATSSLLALIQANEVFSLK